MFPTFLKSSVLKSDWPSLLPCISKTSLCQETTRAPRDTSSLREIREQRKWHRNPKGRRVQSSSPRPYRRQRAWIVMHAYIQGSETARRSRAAFHPGRFPQPKCQHKPTCVTDDLAFTLPRFKLNVPKERECDDATSPPTCIQRAIRADTRAFAAKTFIMQHRTSREGCGGMRS